MTGLSTHTTNVVCAKTATVYGIILFLLPQRLPMAINSRKAPLFNSRRLVRKFTNAVCVQFTLYYISLCRRQNIAFVRTYRAPSGAYRSTTLWGTNPCVSGRDTLPLREWNETCGFVIAYSVCVKCAFRAWNATHSVALIVILLSLLFGDAKRNALKSKKLIKE